MKRILIFGHLIKGNSYFDFGDGAMTSFFLISTLLEQQNKLFAHKGCDPVIFVILCNIEREFLLHYMY